MRFDATLWLWGGFLAILAIAFYVSNRRKVHNALYGALILALTAIARAGRKARTAARRVRKDVSDRMVD